MKKREQLEFWTQKYSDRFSDLVEKSVPGQDFAVFDADGTLWKNDLSEVLLALLENRGSLNVHSLPSWMFAVEIKKHETLLSYYIRLCSKDINMGYFWICQIFAGFTLSFLKENIDELFAGSEPISSHRITGDGSMEEVTVQRPSIFKWQQELVGFLRRHHIKTYIITASQEEFVRMVVSDPQYRFYVAPSHVIGMRLALKTRSKRDILRSDEKQLSKKYYNAFMTPVLEGQTTWYSGKVAAIKENIDPVLRPVLAAGNSKSDSAMLDYCNKERGLKLMVKAGKKSTDGFVESLNHHDKYDQKEWIEIYHE